MKPALYTTTSLRSAIARVRKLERQLAACEESLRICMKHSDSISRDRDLLAKLSAETPPLGPENRRIAEAVRTRVLSQMGMNPDGTFMRETKS